MRKLNQSLNNKAKIWEFINKYFKENKNTPTYQEIAIYMNFKYRQQVQYYVDRLKYEGKLTTIPRKKRSISIIKY